MKQASIGVRAHSGWAALVAVAGDARAPEILERRRVLLVEPKMRGANQPYHFAKNLSLKEAETHLARCAAIAQRLASEAIQEVTQSLHARESAMAGCGILLASGRPLPGLAETLASHAMIHTAEGLFFRRAFREACKPLGIAVTEIRERELFECATRELHILPAKLKRHLADAGKTIGPPWTQDQKSAALIGFLVLARTAGASRTIAARK